MIYNEAQMRIDLRVKLETAIARREANGNPNVAFTNNIRSRLLIINEIVAAQICVLEAAKVKAGLIL